MLIATVPIIEGKEIEEYLGVVSSEIVIGVNAIDDFFAGVRDFFGGRSKAYEKQFLKGKENVLRELEKQANMLGADAIVGLKMDFEALGAKGSMFLIAAQATAVKLKK